MKKQVDDLLKMNLQLFAEDDEGTEGSMGGEEAGEGGSEEQEAYDRSEVDRQISKAVESALKKQRQKFEEEKEAEIEKARQEAEEYSKLTEREKLEKELEKREQELTKKEREIRLRTLKSDVESDLKENGLPVEFSETLVLLEEPEKIKHAVNGIKKTFDEAVNEKVKAAYRQTPPEEGTRVRGREASNKSIRDFARENRIIKD